MNQDFEEQMKAIIERSCFDSDFRLSLISDPKGTIEKEGLTVPDTVNINIVEDTSNTVNIVLPHISSDADQLDIETLKAVAGGKSRNFGYRSSKGRPIKKLEEYESPEILKEKIKDGGSLSWDCGPSGCSMFQCNF